MQAATSRGAVTRDSIRAAAGISRVSDVDRILAASMSGDIAGAREKMIELNRVYGMSESDFLKYASAALFRSYQGDRLGEMLQVMARYDYRILSGANPEIQLAAMLAELAELGRKG